MLVDQSTDEMFVPLNTISEQQKAFLEVQVMVVCTIIILHFQLEKKNQYLD